MNAIRQRRRIVWLILVVATLSSYVISTHFRADAFQYRIVGSIVLLLAFFKARLIGLSFMELRASPLPLRLIFELWVWVVGALLLLFTWL